MCESIYLGVFTFEMFVKIVAYGFVIGNDTYLRDAWCQLDFAVVLLAWLPILVPSFGNYSAIRALRSLRPLRALSTLDPTAHFTPCIGKRAPREPANATVWPAFAPTRHS